MKKEKMEIDLMLEELEEMAQKTLNAKINVVVKGNKSKVAIEGSFLGMLTAISNIIEAVNERMRKKGMNEEDIKKALKASFETGIEATDE
jgi:hypothetical protein|nr:MAG TPA: hypothetical protein [Caudoviricetes sp.]